MATKKQVKAFVRDVKKKFKVNMNGSKGMDGWTFHISGRAFRGSALENLAKKNGIKSKEIDTQVDQSFGNESTIIEIEG